MFFVVKVERDMLERQRMFKRDFKNIDMGTVLLGQKSIDHLVLKRFIRT